MSDEPFKAREPIQVHRLDDDTFALDATAMVPDGETIDSAAITAVSGLTIANVTVNAAEWVYEATPGDETTEVTVEVGYAVLFDVSGFRTATDYVMEFALTFTNGKTRGLDALFQVRGLT